jgi:hypothetical protein
MKLKPDTKIIKAILTEFIPRGDGSFILRPKPVSADLETWVGTKIAATLLGIKPGSIYNLLDPYEPYLVFRRPVKGVYLISLESIQEYKTLSSNPHFWSDENRAERLKFSRAVYKKMCQAAGIKDPAPTNTQPAFTLK